VLLTVTCELDADEKPLLLKATLSQPSSSKEHQVSVMEPWLGRCLSSCGLPSAKELEKSALQEDSARRQVAAKMLEAIKILPSLEMELCLESLAPQAVVAPVAVPEAVLECNEEQLLGEAKRALVGADLEASAAQAAWDDDEARESALKVEVFDGSDCVKALFHSTNLRLRVTDLSTGRSGTRDLHEGDLEPWLEAVGAGHLLAATREADLIQLLLLQAALAPDPGAGAGASSGGVVLEPLREESLESIGRGRLALSLFDPD
jgi:hypothetical protein